MAAEVEQESNSGSLLWPSRDEDEAWAEVLEINSYAVFMGYLSMSVRGLAFLVVTWTTVVLLGGFVSDLEKKDFWCLTVITLAQTAGVFDVFLNEKLSNVLAAIKGLVYTTNFQYKERDMPYYGGDQEDCWVSQATIQVLLLAIISVPLVTFYMFGLYISSAISLWRLIQRDYGNTADGSANQKSALNVLYSLSVAQGAIFCYKITFARWEKKIANSVARKYHFKDSGVVREYLRETRKGCEKDPTFARGRNFITYAVDLMESKSPASYLYGSIILDTLARWASVAREGQAEPFYVGERQERMLIMQQRMQMKQQGMTIGQQHRQIKQQRVLINKQNMRAQQHRQIKQQHMLIKQLVGSVSSGYVFQKLLRTLDPRSPYDGEMQERAGRVVEYYLAGDIRLEQFTGGIHCILAMLELHTVKQEVEAPGWNINLVQQFMNILVKLADYEDNLRVMSNTQGFLSSIMSHVGADQLHGSDHCDLPRSIQTEARRLISRLITAPGETGLKVRHEISTSKKAIDAMQSVLKCDWCSKNWEHTLAMDILTDVSLDKSTKEKFIDSFEDEKEENYIKILISKFFEDKNKKDTIIRELAGEKLAKLSLESKASATIILTANDDVASDLTTVLLDAGNNSCRTSAAEIFKHLCSHYTKDEECFDRLKKALTDAMPKVLREMLGDGSTGEVKTGKEANNNGFSVPDIDLEAGCAAPDSASKAKDISSPGEQKRKQDEDNKLKKALLSLCSMVSDTMITGDPDLGRQLDEVATSMCFDAVRPFRTFASVVKEARELLDEKKQTQDSEIVPAS